MTLSLRIFFIAGIVIFISIILLLLRKKNLNLKYTLLWLFSALVLLVVSIQPNIVYLISKIIGIEAPVNTVFVIGSIFTLLLILSLTVIVSHLNNRIRKLTQEIALLDYKLRDLVKHDKIDNNDNI
jgi:hypothetical protein